MHPLNKPIEARYLNTSLAMRTCARAKLKEMIGDLAERMGNFDGLMARIEELESYLLPDGPVVKGEVEALKKEAEHIKKE